MRFQYSTKQCLEQRQGKRVLSIPETFSHFDRHFLDDRCTWAFEDIVSSLGVWGVVVGGSPGSPGK